MLERAARLDQPELALPGLERELHVGRENGARAVEDPDRAEDAPAREHELGCGIDDRLHLSRSGTVSNPSARSSAWPTRKRVFSDSCGPTSWRPTGSPSLSPQGMLRPGTPAMQDGIVSRSL